MNKFWLVLGMALAFSAFADEAKEGEITFQSKDFTIVAKNGTSYGCHRSAMGENREVAGKPVFHLGVVDISCVAAIKTMMVDCRVSWGPGNYTPIDELKDAQDASAVVHVLTLGSQPGEIKPDGRQDTLAGIQYADLDKTAEKYLKEKCLDLMP